MQIHSKQTFKSAYNGNEKITPKKSPSQSGKCLLTFINVCNPHSEASL